MLLLFIVFVLGAVTVIAIEAVCVVYLIRWLNRRVAREVDKAKPDGSLSSTEDFDFSLYLKQGTVWVLESERIPKALPVDKAVTQQKSKKEVLEVTPTQKFAQIKDHHLVFTESDGSHVEIPLKGCIIAAVSASSLSTRKWAKRYPIKIECRASTSCEGSRILYIYLETCWEKEAWCKSLRLASCEDQVKLTWFAKLNIEFQNYLTSLNAGYPSFMKPYSSVSPDLGDKSSKFDGSSSKVRQFLKKLGKKASKSIPENKGSSISTSDHEERKISERAQSLQDLAFAGGGIKLAPTRKPLDFSTKDVAVPSSTSTSSGLGSRSQTSVTSDADSDERIFGDEGTLCWNLLISRLFFDAKRNDQMKTSLQARIQRTLSNIRIPSYIGEVTCTSVNIGNLPPYIRAMRVLPNWKCNGTKDSISKLVSDLNSAQLESDVDVVVAPPFLYIDQVKNSLTDRIEVSAQNCWTGKGGAFTGEISVEQVKDLGCKWVILGHSERRHVIGENDEFIGKKAAYALSQGVGVIACIGELLEEREAGKTFDVCFQQLKAFADAIPSWDNVVIAYEPVWAIGTGKVASPEQAQEVHVAVRDWLTKNVSAEVASKTRIIYGGSVNGSNSSDLAKKEDIDGFLVGGASLKGPEFATIVNSVTAKKVAA